MLVFDATNNSWGSTPTAVKVARRMFAHGSRFGCIRMRDLDDGRIKVLKKDLGGAGPEELYDDVKVHALGELCCKLFRQAAPDMEVGFMPRVIYKLVQRSNRPKIMCEELLTEGDDFHKVPLSLHPPRDASPEEVVASHRWAAFQYFTYLQSQYGMVFERCDLLNGVWTNPVINSRDASLGGKHDGGSDAIEVWLARALAVCFLLACDSCGGWAADARGGPAVERPTRASPPPSQSCRPGAIPAAAAAYTLGGLAA